MNKWERIRQQRLKEKNKEKSKEKNIEDQHSKEKIPIDLETLKNKMTEEDEAIQIMRKEYREKLRHQNEEQKMLLRMKVSGIMKAERSIQTEKESEVHIRLRGKSDRDPAYIKDK
jgi:hypothetical protein